MTLPLSILGHLWALPTTLIGLIIAAWGSTPVRLDGWEKAWVWHVKGGFSLWWFKLVGLRGADGKKRPIGAQTIGGLILILPECDPQLIPHEKGHVRQGFWLGPLYIPVYYLSCGVAWLQGKNPYYDNWMEEQAREGVGN